MRSARIARVIGLAMVVAAGRRAGRRRGPDQGGIATRDCGSTKRVISLRRSRTSSQVLERHPRDTRSLNRRGICYLRTDQPQKALADFERVNGNSPGLHERAFGDRFGVDSPTYPEAFGNRGIAC